MTEKLTPDQEKRIAATLKRIRTGLSLAKADPTSEPAHIFHPEALNVTSK